MNRLSNELEVDDIDTCRRLARILGLKLSKKHNPAQELFYRFGGDNRQVATELLRQWLCNTRHSFSDTERCLVLVKIFQELLRPDLAVSFCDHVQVGILEELIEETI